MENNHKSVRIESPEGTLMAWVTGSIRESVPSNARARHTKGRRAAWPFSQPFEESERMGEVYRKLPHVYTSFRCPILRLVP